MIILQITVTVQPITILEESPDIEIFPGSSAIYFHHKAMENGETI